MHEYCHRCGGELPASDGVSPFCPHCGSPQIYLQDYESQSGAPESNTTGAVPPPKPQQVEWKTAMRCALLVGVIAAALNQVATRVQMVSLVSMLWIISGSNMSGKMELKAGSKQHQHIVAVDPEGNGTKFGLVALDLPGHISFGDKDDQHTQ